jgi:hypothetical protein
MAIGPGSSDRAEARPSNEEKVSPAKANLKSALQAMASELQAAGYTGVHAKEVAVAKGVLSTSEEFSISIEGEISSNGLIELTFVHRDGSIITISVYAWEQESDHLSGPASRATFTMRIRRELRLFDKEQSAWSDWKPRNLESRVDWTSATTLLGIDPELKIEPYFSNHRWIIVKTQSDDVVLMIRISNEVSQVGFAADEIEELKILVRAKLQLSAMTRQATELHWPEDRHNNSAFPQIGLI